MDSGNSGSLQSSSGGGGGGGGGSDQEYDSRPFFNPLTHLGSTSSNAQQQPSFLLHHQQQQPTFIDPSSFHAFSQSLQPNPNPNPLQHLDAIHSQVLRSVGPNGEDPLSSMQLRSLHESNVRSAAPSDQNNHNNNNPVPRNSKKRTRASRRAPTTVLTTDTSNFRAMVQEFTGIPAPPFTGTSYSRRLDLFGSVGSALRSGHLDGPLYPLRPSAHKVQQSPLLSSPSSLMLNSDITATTTTSTLKPNPSNYQNMPNMQNQNFLSFHPLLHQNPPPINDSAFGAKFSQGSMTLASLDGLGNASFSGGLTNQDQVRSNTFDGTYGNINGCKLDFSASTSDFLNEKGLVDNVVTARGAHEGAVDSWFCSSD